ncbi:MAG TPA: tetratricopeptide repeat protein [Opitutaceae bacterium]|nr:tetratricopeptide repeat protein [Opitutaceae bacterium]
MAVALVAGAACVAYQNSFSVPFILDDRLSILDNPTLAHLGSAWSAPADVGTGGRPLLNLSYAINHAFGGFAIGGYHAVNLLIHICAGLTLFGVVRRTLLQPVLRRRFGAVAKPLALAAAVLWTVHPLQTASVTYVSQRAESLMGLWYLLTLYCFIRSAETEARSPWRWQMLAVVACLLGMATKEVMVTAPLMVWLYDCAFVAGSWREARRRHGRLFLGLAGTWVLLGSLMIGLGARSVGYGLGIGPWTYALTESRAVVLYFARALWPHPLVFDYGPAMIGSIAAAAPYALILAAMITGTVFAWRRQPAAGFAGAWFFLILAPTSSVVPVALQPIAENRAYLPLAGVIVFAVMGAYVWGGRKSFVAFIALAIAWSGLAWKRNCAYRTELGLWADTIAKAPTNARAQENLGNALVEMGRLVAAVPHYERALQLLPTSYTAQENFGSALCRLDRPAEGMAHFKAALRLKPDYAPAECGLGMALLQSGRPAEAIAPLEAALRGDPDLVEAHISLGVALAREGRGPEGLSHFAQALRLKPDSAEARFSLGGAFTLLGRPTEAVAEYETALRLRPNYPEAELRLGDAEFHLGRDAEAIVHYQAAVLEAGSPEACHKLGLALLEAKRTAEAVEFLRGVVRTKPDSADALADLGNALIEAGRTAEAVATLTKAVQLKPELADAHFDLAVVLSQANQWQPAVHEFEEVLRLTPENAEAHYNLGLALHQMGRDEEAIRQLEEALRLRPDYTRAKESLARLRGQ